MLSGAFFLRRYAVWVSVLPVAAVALLAAASGQTEMAVGMIWGTVAVNLGFMGILSLVFKVRATRQTGLRHLLWLALGLGGCMLSGRSGSLGVFSGVGLLAVGLIAVWQGLRQPSADDNTGAEITSPRPWWQGVCSALAVLVVMVGACLVVWRQAVVGAVMGLPPTLCAAGVMAPVLSLVGWMGIRQNGQWQPKKVLHGWLGANVLLATLVLGLAAVVSGGLRLTLSTVGVTLPWVAGMAVVSAVALYLPNKTARYWGGLIVMMYLAYLISLFW